MAVNDNGTEDVNVHEVDEDPEKLIGELIDDPWADDKQDDWPTNPDETDTSNETDKEED